MLDQSRIQRIRASLLLTADNIPTEFIEELGLTPILSCCRLQQFLPLYLLKVTDFTMLPQAELGTDSASTVKKGRPHPLIQTCLPNTLYVLGCTFRQLHKSASPTCSFCNTDSLIVLIPSTAISKYVLS